MSNINVTNYSQQDDDLDSLGKWARRMNMSAYEDTEDCDDLDSLGKRAYQMDMSAYEDTEDCDDLDSLGKRAYQMDMSAYEDDEGYDYRDDVSELTLGSFEEEQEQEEELTEEDRMKIERWTRIREDGFEMINGVKYSAGGSIIYSDYDREEDVEEGDDYLPDFGDVDLNDDNAIERWIDLMERTFEHQIQHQETHRA